MKLRFGDFEFTRESRRLTRQGRPVRLPADQLGLLIALLEKPGIAVTDDQIRRHVWPGKSHAGYHEILALVDALRNSIADGEARLIQALPGVGYRFTGASMVRPAPPERRRLTIGRALLFVLLAIAVAFIAFLIVFETDRDRLLRPFGGITQTRP